MSKAVLVTSSACKVSSDAVGLSNQANRLPEGSGTERGGRGGRVCHHQVEGLSAGGMAGRHRRCMRHLQDGGGRGQVHIWDWCGLRPMQGRHRKRKPTKAMGSSVAAAVIVEMTKSKSTLSVFPSLTHRFDRWKDGSAIGQGRPQQKGFLAH